MERFNPLNDYAGGSAINKANERLNFVTQDKEFLRNYHLREMAMSDWTTGIDTAIEQGRTEGIEIGIEKGSMQKQTEIAKNLLKKGLAIDLIHETTGLDIETIQSLQ
jgi:predicted transposase/invertase (TIGR01784 family)